MMDTVLNLGLNDKTVEGLATLSGDRRFALDSYRRFITMYSDVVMGVHHYTFEDILERHKDDEGYGLDTEMTAGDWETVIKAYKAAIQRELGRPSMCRPWSLVIWARPLLRASPLPAILRRARTHITANSSSMRRAKMWWQAFARRKR